MTYQPWDETRSAPSAEQDLVTLQCDFLTSNPWIPANVDFGAWRDKRVLEVGCGAGAASCLLAHGGARVSAIDITDNAVVLTRQHAAARQLPVTVQQMDAEQLAFPTDHFDHVFSWGVLHHSANPMRAFSEVARVLQRGASATIMVYNRSSLRYYVRGLEYLLLRRKIFAGYTLATVQRFFTDGYYHRHFTPTELRRLLEGLNLVVTRVAVTHMQKRMIPFVPHALDDYAKRKVGWLLVVEVRKPPRR